MKIDEALDWLYSTQLFGIKLGLEGTKRLLDAVQAWPGDGVQVVHVAGTNGKGSTCAMIESLARACGRRTGLFTSPHLVDFRERMRVNGEMIPEGTLLRLLEKVRDAVKTWNPHPTFFELTMAVALLYFKEEGADLLILETGLGGRLDATNAVPKEVAVLAPVGLDHQQYLGGSLREIAGEKAGIIAAGKPVVSAVQAPEAAEVIAARAAKLGAPLLTADSLEGVPEHLGLAGPHQRQNAALALLAARALGLELAPDKVAAALDDTRWPGRFQLLDQGRLVLDGAHNPHAAQALVAAWREQFGDEQASIIFAASSDKDIAGVLRLLAPLAAEWHLPPCSSPRILPPESMQAIVSSLSPSRVAIHASLPTALEAAARGPRRVLAAGSLFLLGDILALKEKGNVGRATLQ